MKVIYLAMPAINHRAMRFARVCFLNFIPYRNVNDFFCNLYCVCTCTGLDIKLLYPVAWEASRFEVTGPSIQFTGPNIVPVTLEGQVLTGVT